MVDAGTHIDGVRANKGMHDEGSGVFLESNPQASISEASWMPIKTSVLVTGVALR